MKKIVLAAVSAKYIHSSLALRYLSRFADNGTRHNLQINTLPFAERKPVNIAQRCRLPKVQIIQILCEDLLSLTPHNNVYRRIFLQKRFTLVADLRPAKADDTFRHYLFQ